MTPKLKLFQNFEKVEKKIEETSDEDINNNIFTIEL
jgi:hypothetical protein